MDWCSGLVGALKGSGIDVWYDQSGLHAGMQWIQTIERELVSRDIFLLVITPQSWASDWVQNELALALLHHKQVLGVIHEPTPNLSSFILIYQLLDVVGRGAEEVANLVVEALRVPQPDMRVITVSSNGEENGLVVIPQGPEDEQPPPTLTSAPPAARLIGKIVPGAADFIASIDAALDSDQPLLHRVAAWARMLEQEGLANLSTYYGKRGLTLLPRLILDGVGLVSLYNFDGAYIQFWRSVFERRAPHALPRVEAIVAPRVVGQGTWTPTITDDLLDALTAAYREGKSDHEH